MLSSRDIVFHLQVGNIVIEPFEEKLLNTNSYDVRLGKYFSRQRLYPLGAPVIRYNTEDGQDKMWDTPRDSGDFPIRIKAGETILCHTEEIIGGRNIITTEMHAKSTTGRYGLSVCKCAGLGDVGFISRWTMEMTNHSNFPILIMPGEPIAQIIFHEVTEPLTQYAGRYGQGEWSPFDMLPKRKIWE